RLAVLGRLGRHPGAPRRRLGRRGAAPRRAAPGGRRALPRGGRRGRRRPRRAHRGGRRGGDRPRPQRPPPPRGALSPARRRAGVASAQRLRIALEDRADTVVTAVVLRPGEGVRALLLGEQHSGRLVDAGLVTVRLPASVERWLRERLGELAAPAPPCTRAIAPEGDVRWLQPELVATVRHRGRLAGGQLRRPELVALRDD